MWAVDGLRSLISSLGNPSKDKAASVQFEEEVVDDAQLGAAYRSNWIARKIVDIPARDSLREWRTWNVDDAALIEDEETRLGVRVHLLDGLIKARIYGGAAILMITDQDPSQPLVPERIGPGGLKRLSVFSKSALTPGPIDQDINSEGFGRPVHYLVQAAPGRAPASIHPSHLIILRADARGDDWMTAGGAEVAWDQSVLVATAEIIRQTSGTFAGVASLIHEANVDVFGIPDLMKKLGESGSKYERTVLQRLLLAATGKSINNSLLMDAKETYQRHSASFADISPIMETFALFAAASADIPATRFLARSPSGMNATGGHDMANYHDKLSGHQELEIRPAMALFDRCLVRSANVATPTKARYVWKPLEQLNDLELAKLGREIAETVKVLGETGLYTYDELRELCTHRLSEVGAFPNLEKIVKESLKNLSLAPLPEEPSEPGEMAA